MPPRFIPQQISYRACGVLLELLNYSLSRVKHSDVLHTYQCVRFAHNVSANSMHFSSRLYVHSRILTIATKTRKKCLTIFIFFSHKHSNLFASVTTTSEQLVCVCVDEGKKRRVKCESFSFSFPSSAQCKFPHTPFFPFARFPSSRTEHVCYDSDEAIKGWLLLLIPFHNAILLLLLDFRESVGNRLRSFPQQQKQKKKTLWSVQDTD